MSGSRIGLAGGGFFDFEEPELSEFEIGDVAHALGHLCRYGGHASRFFSVAQHSVIVSRAVPREAALFGLLHDASEAFLGDVCAPLKRLLPDYQRLEAAVSREVWGRFGLSGPLPDCVYEADRRALAAERLVLMPQRPTLWANLTGVEPLGDFLLHEAWMPWRARLEFLHTYRDLVHGAE
jgi:hypothetical protein